MVEENSKKNRQDVVFVVVFLLFLLSIILFNYIIDPYYIFRDSTIKGINNVKTHKYTNKRTIVYSDMKINSKNKKIAFTGNCLLSHYGSGLDDVGFFTIPVAKVDEVANIIKNLNKLAPNIKTIYWGLFYDDFWNDKNEEVTDTLPEMKTKMITLKDFINLFFSYNTTEYSLDTVRDSIKNAGKDILYVYPYREIARKKYNDEFSFDSLNKVKEIVDFAKENGIDLKIYYSPIHVSKKIHIWSKGQWDSNQELKRKLAEITPYYDYSLFNEYNTDKIDENNYNFIDNIHPSNSYNNLIVFDLLSLDKKIGVEINKENVEEHLIKDTKQLLEFMDSNKERTDKIKNVSEKDFSIAIRRADAI